MSRTAEGYQDGRSTLAMLRRELQAEMQRRCPHRWRPDREQQGRWVCEVCHLVEDRTTEGIT